jgi:hypothetical protein
MNAAMKMPAAPAVPHPDVWDNMPFTLEYGWLNVGELLKAPNGSAGKFKLAPFVEPDIVGDPIKRLRVEFTDTLRPQWANTIFDTCGSQDPRLDEDLPEWVSPAATGPEYRRILRDLFNRLKRDTCDIKRIEGRFERIEKFPDDIVRSVYLFRGVYLAGVVKSAAGPNTDLVLFVANDPQGGPAPDGGATGPPK